MLETSDDYKESYALSIALKDILDISPQNIGYVRYDDDLRRAAKQMRPDVLFSQNLNATNDIRRLVKNFFFDGKAMKEFKSDEFVQQKSFQEDTDKNRVICSIRCKLWGNCRAQNGGLDCRIPVIGFVNQQ